jgi:hypothetical protein
MVDGAFESASEISMAVFVGALLAILVATVLMGGVDDLRRGVRALFAPGPEDREYYTSPKLEDYAKPPFMPEPEEVDE